MDEGHLFAALADPNRRALMDRLRQGPAAVQDLAAWVSVSRPAVSQHLKVLSDAGLLECERAGTRRIYRLSQPGMAGLKAYVDALWDDALRAFTAHAIQVSKEAAMSLDPIVKTLAVPVSPERAFDLFTENLAAWWPLDTHSLSAFDGDLPKEVTVEREKGGKILEEKPDGSVHPWGTITAWEPGARFAMDWHVGRPEAEATFLDVRFEAQGAGTRITLIHDGWAALGDDGAKVRGGYYTGWDMVLGQCYQHHCLRQVATA